MLIEATIAAPEEGGCAFIVGGPADGGTPARYCAAPRRPGSPYCMRHHACCHVAGGSADERRQLREIEALAKAVGGRQGRAAAEPSKALLRRLERVARAALRPNRSRNVRSAT